MKAIAFTVVLLLVKFVAFGQGCVVCTKTASELDKGGAESLNIGIVYLAMIPLTILFSLAYIWWRSNKASI